MDEKEKYTLLRKIAEWLGLAQRRIKDVDEWDGSASRWPDTAAYCDDCLINLNDGPRDEWTQSNCKLPIRDPGDGNDTFVRQVVFAAAVRFEQVDAPAEAKEAARRKLIQAYNEMDAEPPESLTRAVSQSMAIEQLGEQLEESYGIDWWPIDLFYEADSAPFLIIASGGRMYRHAIAIENDLAKLGEAIPVMQEFIPLARTTTTIKRTADGKWRWFSISASSVLNRVGEIDSRDLFDSFATHAEETGEYPIRQFYHAGEAFRTGQADFLARDENLYITSGVYDDTEIAKREVAARQKDPDYWGDSIGYLPTIAPEFFEITESVTIPVYRSGINKEISTLPEKQAANLFTANTEVLGVRRMTLDKRQMEAFVKLFDGNEDEATQWLDEHAESRNRAIEQDGLITRVDDEVPETEAETEEVETIDENEPQEIVHEFSNDQIAEAFSSSQFVQDLAGAIEGLTTQVAELSEASQQRQRQLSDGLQELATRIEALEANDETKRQQWLQDRPRRFDDGGVKHIIRPKVARSADGGEDEMSYADKAAQSLANKKIPVY